MSYKDELLVLVNELRESSNKAKTEEHRERDRRRAEIIDFLVNHPDDAIAVIKNNE